MQTPLLKGMEGVFIPIKDSQVRGFKMSIELAIYLFKSSAYKNTASASKDA